MAAPPLKLELSVPFECAADAEVAFKTLSVDPEPRRSEVSKTLKVDGQNLVVCFTASQTRMMRVAVGSFMDLLILTTETIKNFKPNAQQQQMET